MSFAYLPLFTGDYLRDTRHLTPEEHGIYILLLMHCWDSKGPVPLDERHQCGIANCRSGGEVESLRRVLGEFFVRMEDGWYNKRITDEIARSEAKSAAYRENGLKSAAARRGRVRAAAAKKRLNNPSTTVEPRSVTPSPSLSLSLNHKGEALASSLASQALSAAASPPVISIPLVDKTEFPISQAMVTEWTGLYPDCDVLQTLREIRGWNLANPTKRKTRSGVLNHINRWLAKEHNRG